jgi:hypothetical protein
VYDEGDETDPAQAYASFSGPAGEQAWLDKAEDGMLTGWVRDETGQVWRYSDPDAWAIDVDDAGMAQTGGAAADDAVPGPEAAEGDQLPAIEDATPAGDGSMSVMEFATADEVSSGTSAGGPDDELAGPEMRDDPAGEGLGDDESEEDEEELPSSRQKGKKPRQ